MTEFYGGRSWNGHHSRMCLLSHFLGAGWGECVSPVRLTKGNLSYWQAISAPNR